MSSQFKKFFSTVLGKNHRDDSVLDSTKYFENHQFNITRESIFLDQAIKQNTLTKIKYLSEQDIYSNNSKLHENQNRLQKKVDIDEFEFLQMNLIDSLKQFSKRIQDEIWSIDNKCQHTVLFLTQSKDIKTERLQMNSETSYKKFIEDFDIKNFDINVFIDILHFNKTLSLEPACMHSNYQFLKERLKKFKKEIFPQFINNENGLIVQLVTIINNHLKHNYDKHQQLTIPGRRTRKNNKNNPSKLLSNLINKNNNNISQNTSLLQTPQKENAKNHINNNNNNNRPQSQDTNSQCKTTASYVSQNPQFYKNRESSSTTDQDSSNFSSQSRKTNSVNSNKKILQQPDKNTQSQILEVIQETSFKSQDSSSQHLSQIQQQNDNNSPSHPLKIRELTPPPRREKSSNNNNIVYNEITSSLPKRVKNQKKKEFEMTDSIFSSQYLQSQTQSINQTFSEREVYVQRQTELPKNIEDYPINKAQCQMIMRLCVFTLNQVQIILSFFLQDLLAILIQGQQFDDKYGSAPIYRQIIIQRLAEKIVFNDRFQIGIILQKTIKIFYQLKSGNDYLKYSQIYKIKPEEMQFKQFDDFNLELDQTFLRLMFKRIKLILRASGFTKKFIKIQKFSRIFKDKFVDFHPGKKKLVDEAETRADILTNIMFQYGEQGEYDLDELKRIHNYLDIMLDSRYGIFDENVENVLQFLFQFLTYIEALIYNQHRKASEYY